MRTALVLGAAVVATLGSWVEANWPAYLACVLFLVTALSIPNLKVPFLAAIPIALSLWAAIQACTGFTAYRHASLVSSFWWTAAAAAYVSAASLLDSAPIRHIALKVLGAFAGASACFALAQPNLSGFNPDTMIGPFPNRNIYACFAELTLPIVVWLARRTSPAQWLWWGVAAALVASVIHSGTRAGSAMILVEIFVMAAFVAPRARVAISGAVLSLCMLLGATLWTRLQYNDPLVHRREIYRSALQMIEERPLTGHGMGAFQAAYPRFATFDVGRVVNHAHNDWLELAATGGVPAMLALTGFFAISLRNLRSHLWAYGIPAVLLHSLVDFPLNRIGVFAWLMTLTGALQATATGRVRSTRDPMNAQPQSRKPRPVEQIASV